MKTIKVKAKFIGASGSCGFLNHIMYEFDFTVNAKTGTIFIDSAGRTCEYTNIISFLNNWKKVTKI